eukprot:TRINITY_DN3065_c0_g1_i4.p2 TRINITY_DN3065_c0_g1~~TRINITY_DN3065_c0_g1_i4.p2  ORF type:complete len:222 (+),score=47.97 TRINITY_DN3065_c0_g1_i4:1561-2226(+)
MNARNVFKFSLVAAGSLGSVCYLNKISTFESEAKSSKVFREYKQKELEKKISAVKRKNPALFSQTQQDTPLDTALNFHILKNNDIEFTNPLVLYINGKEFKACIQAIEADSKTLSQFTRFLSPDSPSEEMSCTISNDKALSISGRTEPFFHEKNEYRELSLHDGQEKNGYFVFCITRFFKDKETEQPVTVTRLITYNKSGKMDEPKFATREKWLNRFGVNK